MKDLTYLLAVIAISLFLSSCAQPISTVSLPDGRDGYEIAAGEGKLSFPADDFEIFLVRKDTYRVENKRLKSPPVILCLTPKAEAETYQDIASDPGHRYKYDTVSSTRIAVDLPPGFSISKEKLNINYVHIRMMAVGNGPGFSVLTDPGHTNSTGDNAIEAIKAVLLCWKLRE